MRLRDRINKVGIQLPTVEVHFQDLKIDADIYVGNRALPTLINYPRNMLEDLLGAMHLLPSRKKPFPILHSLSGILKPGRMTLLLGPPGAGKTTLMLALAGKLSQDLRKTGRITYNGHDLTEFIPQRTAAYISQNDVHIGTLTVRETLDFSARVQGAKYRSALTVPGGQGIALSSGDSGALITDYIMKILGLDICADTLVGNEMIRGISGGQKKRVTTGKGPDVASSMLDEHLLTLKQQHAQHGTGEMVVGPKRTIFMDEISTGLDSSTTYAIVRCMRNFTHILRGTILMALLQPAPETYNLFDDLLLLSEGQIVYHGPKDGVEDFLLTLGFKCPERKGIADFLQEVTSSKDQEQYWADKSRPYSYVPSDGCGGGETRQEGDYLYIFLEYIPGGSIHKLLQEFGKFDEPLIRTYTRQILGGLAYLHNKNTVHRDIKGANILVDTHGQVKLADFGMAKHSLLEPLLKLALLGAASPSWPGPSAASSSGRPQAIRGSETGYDLAVDIWSLGCTVLEMVAGKPPWSDLEVVAVMFKISNGKDLPAIPDDLSAEGHDFVQACLQRRSQDRPSAAALLDHPFVRNAAPDINSVADATKSPSVIALRNHVENSGELVPRPRPQRRQAVQRAAALAPLQVANHRQQARSTTGSAGNARPTMQSAVGSSLLLSSNSSSLLVMAASSAGGGNSKHRGTQPPVQQPPDNGTAALAATTAALLQLSPRQAAPSSPGPILSAAATAGGAYSPLVSPRRMAAGGLQYADAIKLGPLQAHHGDFVLPQGNRSPRRSFGYEDGYR
eukprot:SM000258S09117  [mRNA]  locus=s258:114716:120085:- [translate_table: standard]